MSVDSLKQWKDRVSTSADQTIANGEEVSAFIGPLLNLILDEVQNEGFDLIGEESVEFHKWLLEVLRVKFHVEDIKGTLLDIDRRSDVRVGRLSKQYESVANFLNRSA